MTNRIGGDFGAEAIDAIDHATGGIVGGRGDLVDRGAAGVLVNQDQVGERATYVNSDALHE